MKRGARAVLFACAIGSAACQTASGPVDSLLAQHKEALEGARDIEPGIELSCAPAEAEVAVDGVLQGTCADLEGRMLPLAGREGHSIEVKRAGFRPYTARLAAGNARTKLKVELVPSG